MELALFPIAAILLLLSGVSAPARSAARQAGTAALMREFLRTNTPIARGSRSAAITNQVLAHYLPEQLQRAADDSLNRSCARLQPQHAGALQYSFDGKRFKTRFGFAEGAYRGLAPPRA